jgi:hypothetical protein
MPAQALRQTPPEPVPRVSRLDSMPRVRREMVRVYRETRLGRLATQDATRLVNILFLIGRVLEGGELEERIRALEAQDGEPRP